MDIQIDFFETAKTFDQWQALMIEAEGRDAVRDVARRIRLDPVLPQSDRDALTKAGAKALKTTVKALLHDLGDPLPGAADEDERRVIFLDRREPARTLAAVLDVLPAIPNLRVRGRELVTVVTDGASVFVQPLAPASFPALVSTVSRWVTSEGAAAPDEGVLRAVLAAGSWPKVPRLQTLADQPLVHANGMLVDEPGNHGGIEAIFPAGTFPRYAEPFVHKAESRALLLQAGALTRPEECEVMPSTWQAMACLRWLLSGFNFRSGQDEAVALAAILTAANRAALPTAPAFAVSGPDFGAGKTTLARLIALFAAPASAPMAWAARREEREKRIDAALLEGRRVLLFDNLAPGTSIGGDHLAALLTDEHAAVRVLGSSSMPQVSTRALFLFTGVGIQPGADLCRRMLVCHVSPHKSPDEIRAQGCPEDPEGLVKDQRGAWVMAALKVLQGVAGLPRVPALDSFAGWSRTVRKAVMMCGLPDPVEAIRENHEQDVDAGAVAQVLHAWHEACTEPIPLRDLLRLAEQNATLHDALLGVASGDGGLQNTIIRMKLAAWLRGHQGRVVGGLRLANVGKRRDNAVLWLVGPI